MRKLVLIVFLLLAACGSGSVSSDMYARQWLDTNGKKDAKVTKLVQGNPKSYKADELWCMETDSTTSDGRAFLVTLWRTGSTWQGKQMTDDQYEWDLNGCPDH